MRPEEYATLRRVEDEHWWYRQLRRVVRWHLDRFAPGWQARAILDAGCGTGGNLAHLPGAGRRVGLDVSTDALACARKRNLTQLVRGTVASLPFAAASFDAAISTSVIYHQWVRDPAVALRELHRVLRPGGLLFLDVPAYASLASSHDVARCRSGCRSIAWAGRSARRDRRSRVRIRSDRRSRAARRPERRE